MVVGQLERVYYLPFGLTKFDKLVADGLAELVYDNGETKIYLRRMVRWDEKIITKVYTGQRPVGQVRTLAGEVIHHATTRALGHT